MILAVPQSCLAVSPLLRVFVLFNKNHISISSSCLFTSDFFKLLDYFTLTQYVKQPSHDKGHTLDLVLSHGFCVDDVNLVYFAMSDHNAVCFQVPLLSPDPKPPTLIRPRPLNSLYFSCFCQAFTASHISLIPVNNMASP